MKTRHSKSFISTWLVCFFAEILKKPVHCNGNQEADIMNKLKIFLLFAVPLAIGSFVLISIFEGITLKTILTSIVSGIFYGLIFPDFGRKLSERRMKKIIVQTEKDESIVKAGGANHLVGSKGVPGKLALTQKRLVFQSVSKEEKKSQSILLGDIKGVSMGKSLGLLKNVLLIELVNNQNENFVVGGPSEWILALKES